MSREPPNAANPVEADAQGVGRSTLAHRSALVALGLLFLGFCALGVWQLERRAWKLALIDRVEQRIHAPAAPAPARVVWTDAAAANWEYRHVEVTGHFLPDADTVVQAVTELGPGYWLLTPLRTVDGATVLVNRGFVARRPALRREVGPAGAASAGGAVETVTGLLRLAEPGGAFLRRNDAAADRWFSRDVVAIARARGIEPVAPFFIDADASSGPGASAPDAPVGGLTVVRFRNSHLVYALTWFALAAMTVAAGWQVTRADRRQRRARSRSPVRIVETSA